MLKIKNLVVEDILQNINLTLKKGKITTIIGANGSGKSTLAKCIANLIKYQGTITYEEQEKFYVGYVFQNPEYQFVRNIVIDDLAFSLESLNLSRVKMLEEIEVIAKEFKIDKLLNKFVDELSGGEKQKVALVANLILKPKVLILDEAYEMIDEISKQEIKNILQKYVKENKIICLQITHNQDIIEISDKIVVLDNKQLSFIGTKMEFYQQKELLQKLSLELPLYEQIRQEFGLSIKTRDEMDKLLCNLNLKM
ncbi:MAG: energy-coupling factor ABC transporter ATP-binding protein [Mycoplasmatales bacterium]